MGWQHESTYISNKYFPKSPLFPFYYGLARTTRGMRWMVELNPAFLYPHKATIMRQKGLVSLYSYLKPEGENIAAEALFLSQVIPLKHVRLRSSVPSMRIIRIESL